MYIAFRGFFGVFFSTNLRFFTHIESLYDEKGLYIQIYAVYLRLLSILQQGTAIIVETLEDWCLALKSGTANTFLNDFGMSRPRFEHQVVQMQDERLTQCATPWSFRYEKVHVNLKAYQIFILCELVMKNLFLSSVNRLFVC